MSRIVDGDVKGGSAVGGVAWFVIDGDGAGRAQGNDQVFFEKTDGHPLEMIDFGPLHGQFKGHRQTVLHTTGAQKRRLGEIFFLEQDLIQGALTLAYQALSLGQISLGHGAAGV